MVVSALTTFLSVLLFVSSTFILYAGESVITNSVSVTSNSGGNRASEGVIVEGSAESSVKIETIINNEVVTYIEETSNIGQIYIENAVVSNEDLTTTTSQILTATNTKIETEEVHIPENDTKTVGILEKLSSLIAYVFSLFRT